jgi:hypothetical protein
MDLTRLRCASCFFAAVLVFPAPSAAFDTPLSDTAIREAYFMGQRRDESMARFLDKYVKHLQPLKSGPYVSSITLLSPYAQVIVETSQHLSGYSAQQAQIDHRDRKETVRAIIEIQLTETYPAFIPDPGRNGPSSAGNLVLRPFDFWRDFQIEFLDREKELRPFSSSGRPNYLCSDESGCILAGATLEFEFLASAFPTDSATVRIDPPEGDSLALDFDLASLR